MVMKKFINDPSNLTDELLEGLALDNQDVIELQPNHLVVNKGLAGADRVAIVSMGGSGHEPCCAGFTGNGMLDIAVIGDIFAAPGAQPCFEALQKAEQGKGVLYIVLNHAGDMLSGNMAMKMAAKKGLNVRKVVTQEDISIEPRSNADNRRGLVGCVAVYKIAGAAAAAGKSLDEVTSIAQYVADNMATLAAAMRGATHPVTGAELASLPDDEMEIGMGQHGEEGGGRCKIKTADETADVMADALIKDLDIKRGEKVLLLINGSGATTLMEQLLIYRRCVKHLGDLGIEVAANYVGELLTTQEQAGFQMSMIRMNDELLNYWNAPCNTAYFKK